MARGEERLGKWGERLRNRRAVGVVAALALCAATAGCRTNPHRAEVEKNLFNERAGQAHQRDIVERYLVACPDVLEIHVAGRDEFKGQRTVAPDGTLSLGQYGSVRVEGLTLPAVARAVAEPIGVRPEDVHVRVTEFASRHLILVGEVVGRQRRIPYQGQETVLDVLQRVGGITPGAEPTEIYVVRSHVGDLQRPEVFHVDLQSIVLEQDQSTNIRVRPYDQIYVGETRQARVEKCVPPWFRPAYQKLWNMIPSKNTPQEMQHTVTAWIRGWFGLASLASDPSQTSNVSWSDPRETSLGTQK